MTAPEIPQPGSPRASLRARPKALLHEHLDGGLRPVTLLELCRRRGIATPEDDAERLGTWMHAHADSGSLEMYLRGFALTVAAMASPRACERVAYEAAEDAAADGCVLAEFRMAPLLLEPHGLAPEAAVEAMLAGLARASIPCGLIVCAMRTSPLEESVRAARLGARYAGHGVVGFDLAGAERGFPPGAHAAAIDIARDAGLGITLHAGESDEGFRVLEAAKLGATRIGHGIHIMSGDAATTGEWVHEAAGHGLHFEVCPSSNVHTGAVRSISEHPIARMARAGLSVSCSTDNRLMSGVTLTAELEALRDRGVATMRELAQFNADAARHSFLPAAQRERAVQLIDEGWADALA